jgi:hypothetical protein
MRTLSQEQIDRTRLKCRTQPEILLAYLWYVGDWVPTHDLQGHETLFGFIGSAGAVRARELARNAPEIPEALHNKVERVRGAAIGRHPPQEEFFRYKPQPKRLTRAELLAANAENVRAFDAAV